MEKQPAAKMDYRAYILDRNGHFKGVEDFFAQNDDAALDIAAHLERQYGIELWQRARCIAVLTQAPTKAD